MSDSEREWAKIGSSEPYWGVLSNEKFKMRNLSPVSKQEFFQSGERLIREVFDVIHTTLIADFKPVFGLDFGCGVGRLTIPLSGYCSQVVGVDVSLGMIAEARNNCAAYKITNIDFTNSLSNVKNGVDFIITEHVLQHIEKKRGVAIIDNLLEKLNPSGIACIHFPYYIEISSIKKFSLLWSTDLLSSERRIVCWLIEMPTRLLL